MPEDEVGQGRGDTERSHACSAIPSHYWLTTSIGVSGRTSTGASDAMGTSENASETCDASAEASSAVDEFGAPSFPIRNTAPGPPELEPPLGDGGVQVQAPPVLLRGQRCGD